MDVVIKVQGMSCAQCEKTVKNAIKSMAGVRHAEVHLGDGTVNLDYDQEQVNLEAICEKIEQLGYEVDR